MTNREKELFELIQSNPMMSQNELADKLKITRTSVGVHISNLIKKGHILGKGYILESDHPITVIGGANVDLQGQSYNTIKMADSNPGIISMSLGGVGRNIAENAALLGLPIRLITAVGNDVYGERIKENARERGIDLSDSLMTSSERTSTYMYILDTAGDMLVAVSDMVIIEKLDETFLVNKLKKINLGAYTVIDANLSQATIEYLTHQLSETKLIFDTVSTTKAIRAKNVLGRFYAIKPNRLEAEMLLDCKISNKDDVVNAANQFLSMGVKVVMISLGKDGIYYTDGDIAFFKEPIIKHPVNTTGAGDAFIAGLLYGLNNHLNSEELVEFCLGAASITSLSHETISNEFNQDAIIKLIKEKKI